MLNLFCVFLLITIPSINNINLVESFNSLHDLFTPLLKGCKTAVLCPLFLGQCRYFLNLLSTHILVVLKSSILAIKLPC